MGKRWYTKDRIEVSGRVLDYVGSRTKRKNCKSLIDKERKKAGKVKLMFRIIKSGNKYRVYVGRSVPMSFRMK